jgi:Tol biopolymer transport system component
MVNEHRPMRSVVLGLVGVMACTRPNPQSCADGLCSDPELPFCDIDGALEGSPNTCVAVDCTAREFIACRGDDALICNATGTNIDVKECEERCEDAARGCTAFRTAFVVFVSNRDGNSEIYRMNPDGSLPTNLTVNPAEDTLPLWDPTGESIAFLSDRDGVNELFVMRADGSEPANVSQGSAAFPAWSPDGLTLAFVSDRNGGTNIFSVRAEGGSVLALTTTGTATTPDWSHDGGHIAYSDAGVVHVMESSGSNATDLMRFGATPRWSPNGLRLAFVARNFQIGGDDISFMNADGSGAMTVTMTANINESRHLWSPDGQRLVGQTNQGEIFVLDAGSLDYTNLTMSSAIDDSPSWSPDGATILFASDRTGDVEVFAVPTAGGAPVNLSLTVNAFDSTPSARPSL